MITLYLTLLTIFLYLEFRKIIYKKVYKIQNNFKYLRDKYNELVEENVKLKRENTDFEKMVEETIGLYELTREICKTLDPEQLHANFCTQLNKYIKIQDCKFLESNQDLAAYNEYTIIPLYIGKDLMGYLLTRGVPPEDMDKFNILSQQFLLGLKRAVLYQKIQELAITDSLTGLFNRRYCLQRLNEEIERSKKFRYNLSFLMVDIDHFKNYNDHYGHLVGDAILKEVAKTIKENTREMDLVGRYGGEEFLVILTETDKKQARAVAERIRQAVAEKEYKIYDENLKITISIGMANFPQDAQEATLIIDRADKALYKAKQTGRNRVY